MTISNSLEIDTVIAQAREFGRAVGAGKATPVDNGRYLFEASRQVTKIDTVAYYRAYAEGQNEADTYGEAVDLKNEKSVAAQASKLGVFVTLAASHPDQRADLIDRTVNIIRGLPGKKPSIYESVLKVARAQIKALGVNLSDEQIIELVTPADAKEVTRVSSLEAQIKAAEKHSDLFSTTDAQAVLRVLYDLLGKAKLEAIAANASAE